MKLPPIDGIDFTENAERLKIILPVHRNWLLLGLFSVCLLIWIVMLVGILIFLIRDVVMVRERFTFWLSVILLVWLFFWYWLGRVLWRRWQYFAANREILFIYPDQLIVRRPISILGMTTTYDIKHVSPFYYSDQHQCLAFDYAYQHVYFGYDLAAKKAQALIAYLNGRYFPDRDDDE